MTVSHIYNTFVAGTKVLAFAISIGLFFSVYSVANAQVPDALLNGNFELDWGTRETAYDWQNFQGGYVRSNAAAHGGEWSLKVETDDFNSFSGAYQRFDLGQTELKPVFIGGYVKGENIQNASGGYFGAGIYVEIHHPDGSISYWNSLANYGTFDWRWIGFNTGAVDFITKPIDYIFIVPLIGRSRGTAYFDDLVAEEHQPSQSALTIIFDDGEENVRTEAMGRMDSKGFVGTVAVPTETIGTDGYMHLGQLNDLKNRGWEIMSHGLSHGDLTTFSKSRIRRELSQSKRRLEGYGFTVNNFALPFGAFTDYIINEGAKLYRSVRKFEQGENPQGTFEHDVKVRGVLESTTVADVANWVTNAQAEGKWLVLTFHSIAKTGDDAYYTDPDVFHDMLHEVEKTGIEVVTYNEGLNRFVREENTI